VAMIYCVAGKIDISTVLACRDRHKVDDCFLCDVGEVACLCGLLNIVEDRVAYPENEGCKKDNYAGAFERR